jgi:hypothetical protein
MTIVYHSFEEAHARLNIPCTIEHAPYNNTLGIESLKIVDHPGSYVKMNKQMDFIDYVGIGKSKTPGHPTLNQNVRNQQGFYLSKISRNIFPVLFKDIGGWVTFLGYYIVNDIEKKIGPSGFTYFSIKLFRVAKIDNKIYY